MKVIPSTAAEPVEYIPATQDHEKFEIEQSRTIRIRKEALERDRGVLTDKQVKDEEDGIAAQQEQFDEQLRVMRVRFPNPQRILVMVATPLDRDRVNSRLIEMGLTQASEEVIKSTMIEELFKEQWGEHPVDSPENDALADETANFLDGVWQRQEAHNAAVEKWQEQEVERLLDEQNGAPKRERGELPPKIISIRENARLQLVIDRMMRTNQRLRTIAAGNVDYQRRNHEIIVQMHVVGVNFETTVPIVRDPRTKALSLEAVTALRAAMDDESWTDLYLHIDKMYRLNGGEEKNSDWPLENLSGQSGSAEPTDGPASSDGSSKISPSTPVLAVASETTTGPSSSTGSDAAPVVLKVVSDTPTDAA
jgi:hypothetical protein